MAFDRLKNWIAGEASPPEAPDEKTAKVEADSDANDAALASQAVERFLQHIGLVRTYDIHLKDYEAGQAILDAPRELQLAIALEAAARLPRAGQNHYGRVQLKAILTALLRKNLPFDQQSIEQMVASIASARYRAAWELPIGGILRVVEQHVKDHGVSDALRKSLKSLNSSFNSRADYADNRKAGVRIEAMLDSGGTRAKAAKLDSGEAWTGALQAQLDALDETAQSDWHALITHCATATSSKPSKRWLKQCGELIGPIGTACYFEVMIPCLQAIGKPGSTRTIRSGGYTYETEPTQIQDTHADVLRGLVWSTTLVDDEELIRAVGNAAEACFKKIPGIGPRSSKIGNACLHALSGMNSMSGVAQISRLKTRAKHASARNQLAKALERAATNVGMTQADLEEIAVPSFGLTEVGRYREQIGDFTAELSLEPTGRTKLRWIKPDGKTQKSVPAAVKETHADAIKQIKSIGKDIEKMLPSQRDRLEQIFLAQRQWKLSDFRERFLDQPLVGALARRLIWRFQSDTQCADAIWHDGKLTDYEAQPLDWLDDTTKVTPWHPMLCKPVEVQRWREWLEQHEICQPFKQAHREIYILTDAERNTDTYSNRFAAHLIRQHQFAALCQQRGWRYGLQGAWDSHNTPFIDLPGWQMRVEFWVEALGEEYGADTSGAGIFLHLTTDQVRFYNLNEQGPLSLADVPPLVFSEMMRDVDLFVGVCSVGNDPNWADGGPDGQYRGYWESYAFGDLSQSAQTRKDVLQRLIPRLKIADRCTLIDRYLVVRGQYRAYKIHLGSSNILMSPNDEYLCIVPKQGAGAKRDGLFLPFEGDNTLSVILSKAFMLAEDHKIKDSTIVSQIRG